MGYLSNFMKVVIDIKKKTRQIQSTTFSQLTDNFKHVLQNSSKIVFIILDKSLINANGKPISLTASYPAQPPAVIKSKIADVVPNPNIKQNKKDMLHYIFLFMLPINVHHIFQRKYKLQTRNVTIMHSSLK